MIEDEAKKTLQVVELLQMYNILTNCCISVDLIIRKYSLSLSYYNDMSLTQQDLHLTVQLSSIRLRNI